MDPARELAQLGQRVVEVLARRRELVARGRRIGGDPGVDEPQLEGEGDEPLLRAVVEVALEALALGVADLDEPRPRRGELVAGVGVRERLGHEVGEVRQPPAGVRRQALRLAGRGGERPPQRTGDGDRGGHGRAEPERPQPVGERTVGVLVAVDPCDAARAVDAGDDGVAVEVGRGAEGDAVGPGLRVGRDDGRAVVRARSAGG